MKERFSPIVEKREKEEDKVRFEDLHEKDVLIVDTGDDPDNIERREITITGALRTKDGEIKYLNVEFINKSGDVIVAQTPGSFEKHKEKDNVSKGEISKAENHCLYFENLNYRDKTENGKKVRYSTSERTMPIRRILLRPFPSEKKQ